MFKGAYTAIVTPFNRSGDVDYARLRELIDVQIAEGVDGLVPVGTTGESPTLDYEEHIKVIEATVESCRGRVKVIGGTGANSTREALELTRLAKKAGVDATLQVTPYYNRPNQEGLLRHFMQVADVGLPVVLYNVPSRTGREIAVETVVELAKHPNIVALKEAGGSVDRVSNIVRQCRIDVISGDDALTLPMMAVGAVGVISVASNIIPRQVSKMVHHMLDGHWLKALELHRQYHQLFCDLFIDTNPLPVKTALALMGKIENMFRLPLLPMNDKLKEKLAVSLKSVGLLP